VEIRIATDQDWPSIYLFYSAIMAEGRTYPFPAGQNLDEAKPWWMEEPPGRTVVAVAEGSIVGSAKMGANRPGKDPTSPPNPPCTFGNHWDST
jgi:hypothetical protein